MASAEGGARVRCGVDGPATAWGNVLSFAPAARSAERMAAEAVARTQPATTTPVGVWLARAGTPSVPGQSLPAATRAAGRWQSAGLAFHFVDNLRDQVGVNAESHAQGRLRNGADQFLLLHCADLYELLV